ncbi:hypothetical protein [Actinophytocola gossypii]|uniref:Uncharacterized protein n=1 Tax=Actinophytocola gossypii TaxID=2812003 RepID=A0ABT2J4N2_9PSEU|nr:hypothetical protein [Actinophytocola gossypii]MCT2582825.1 hypothetical protein [Actinophytocola gossypii]
MNWTQEAVRAELAYRVEQAVGDRGTTAAHVLAARERRPSWWRRLRTRLGHPVGASPT